MPNRGRGFIMAVVLRSLLLALALAPASAPAPGSPTPAEYLALGRFEAAAAAIEATGDLERLRLAAEIRVGLGQRERADADLAVIERAQPSPAAAAAAFWERRALLHTDLERREHATTYLRHHARAGGRERQALAELTLATSLYDAACEHGLLAGLCLSVRLRWYPATDVHGTHRWRWPPNERKTPWYARCEGHHIETFRGHPRAAKLSARARSHLQRARRLLGDLVDLPARPLSAEVVQAGLIAELLALEPKLEAHLARKPPKIRVAPDRYRTGTADTPERRRIVRQQLAEIARTKDDLAAFLKDLDRDAAALHARYSELARQANAGSLARASWLRAALVAHHQAATLIDWEPERGFASLQDARAHCERLELRNEPLLRLARDAYGRCLADARATGHLGLTAELCEDVLDVRWPEDSQPVDELLDPCPRTASRPISIGVQLDAPSLATAASASLP